MVFDPTAPFCAYCYKQNGEKLKKCSKCHSRCYCSRACQAQDWRLGCHKLFCGQVGEIGVDYEIRPSPSKKGLGVFARRDIHRDETILAERSVAETASCMPKEESVRAAIMALTPLEGLTVLDRSSFRSKFERNNVGGLHLNFSRVNHDCIGNSHHAFDEKRGVILLVASTTIRKGEEIFYSYTFQTPHSEAIKKHSFCWDFTCTCRACRVPKIAHKLDLMIKYDHQIVKEGRETHECIDIATKKLLPLYNEFECSSYFYSRIYSDLFQFSITQRKTYEQAMNYIRLAYQESLNFFGYEAPLTKKKYNNVLHPEESPNYMALEYG